MSFKTHLLSTTIASLMAGAAFAAGAQASSVGLAGALSPLMADAQPQEAPLQGGGSCNPCAAKACNPCNPCAAKNACNPCNPCAAKNACNPCNPCAAKACNPCNPCAAKNACNPCNPCAAKKNPCGSGADNPNADQASGDIMNMDAIPA